MVPTLWLHLRLYLGFFNAWVSFLDGAAPVHCLLCLGSGMDTPLMALRMLFQQKFNLVKYLPLGSHANSVLSNSVLRAGFHTTLPLWQHVTPTCCNLEVQQRTGHSSSCIPEDEPSSTFAVSWMNHHSSSHKCTVYHVVQLFWTPDQIKTCSKKIGIPSCGRLMLLRLCWMISENKTWMYVGCSLIMSPPWEAFLYAAGFPCTPFSVLHGDSALLGDSEAAQLFEVIRRLKLLQPVAACPNSSMLTVHWNWLRRLIQTSQVSIPYVGYPNEHLAI